MFYERLNLLCEHSGTTITAFVKSLGVSGSAATSWKKGTMPNARIVVLSANHFGVSADYLLGITDDPRPYSSLDSERALTYDEETLIENLRSQPRETRLRIMKSMNVMMGKSPDLYEEKSESSMFSHPEGEGSKRVHQRKKV